MLELCNIYTCTLHVAEIININHVESYTVNSLMINFLLYHFHLFICLHCLLFKTFIYLIQYNINVRQAVEKIETKECF